MEGDIYTNFITYQLLVIPMVFWGGDYLKPRWFNYVPYSV